MTKFLSFFLDLTLAHMPAAKGHLHTKHKRRALLSPLFFVAKEKKDMRVCVYFGVEWSASWRKVRLNRALWTLALLGTWC